MPHVIVKLWPGRSEKMKKSLAEKIAKDVAEELNVELGDVSVAFEEVDRDDWEEKVYKPEISGNMDKLYVKPDYDYE